MSTKTELAFSMTPLASVVEKKISSGSTIRFSPVGSGRDMALLGQCVYVWSKEVLVISPCT